MDTFITIMIVAVVGALLIWSFYKTLTGKDTKCGSCGGCKEPNCDQRKD